MQRIKGIVAGFIAGAAFASGVVLLMRDSGSPAAPSAELAAVNAQIQRLERAVSRLSETVAANGHGVVPGPVASQAPVGEILGAKPESERTSEQVQAIALADAMVDRGMQSGQWTHAQATELHAAVSELDRREAARILARISAAINADQLRVELP